MNAADIITAGFKRVSCGHQYQALLNHMRTGTRRKQTDFVSIHLERWNSRLGLVGSWRL